MVTETGPCICLVVTDLTEVEARTDHIRFLEEHQEALKASQRETQESERKFRGLFENSTNAVFLTIPDGSIVAANPAACALLGWTEEELCGMDSSAIMDTSDSRVSEAVEERRRTGFIQGWELTAIRKDGKRIPIEVDSAIIPGEPARSFAMWRDITDRKQDEEALRQQARLLDLSREAILVWEFRGAIEFWNEGATKLYGYSREDVIGKVSHELLATTHPKGIRAVLVELERSGHWRGDLTHRTKDGHIVIVEASLQLIQQSGRRLVLETNRDITERKHAEHEREQLLSTIANERERLKAILASIDDEVWVVDTSGKTEILNAPATAGLGIDVTKGETLDNIVESLEILTPDGNKRSRENTPLFRSLRGEAVRGEETIRQAKNWRDEAPQVLRLACKGQ